MITLLIPAYNEEENVERLVATLDETVRLAEDYEMLLVNDGSSDATAEILASLRERYPRLTVVTHEQNKGLGAALQTGFQHARGRIIVTMDADLTHPTELIGTLVEACDDDVDFVVASRYVPGGGMAGVPAWRVALSRVANTIFQVLYGTRLRDITAGFKAYRADRMRDLHIIARGFEVQLEITIRLLARGATFREVPYVLKNREHGVSKMRYMRLIPKYSATMFQLFRHRWRLGRTQYD